MSQIIKKFQLKDEVIIKNKNRTGRRIYKVYNLKLYSNYIKA